MKLKELFESTGKSVADLNIDYTDRNDFRCNDFDLTSLEGSPKKVTGLFDCSHNELTSLAGGPSTSVIVSCATTTSSRLSRVRLVA